MIYLDSSVCVYLMEDYGDLTDVVEQLMREHPNEFCASALVRMECLIKPLRDADIALESSYRRFFESLPVIDITAAVFERATRLRASTGLKTPDALHLATAVEGGCEALWTGDADLAKRSNGYAVNVFAGL